MSEDWSQIDRSVSRTRVTVNEDLEFSYEGTWKPVFLQFSTEACAHEPSGHLGFWPVRSILSAVTVYIYLDVCTRTVLRKGNL